MLAHSRCCRDDATLIRNPVAWPLGKVLSLVNPRDGYATGCLFHLPGTPPHRVHYVRSDVAVALCDETALHAGEFVEEFGLYDDYPTLDDLLAAGWVVD